ncbi:MAG: hypothetical protein GJ677_18830 [Rhodobacteraceae bacterium]|nr:hypothetical protein [Paracoccaceae bacterium]
MFEFPTVRFFSFALIVLFASPFPVSSQETKAWPPYAKTHDTLPWSADEEAWTNRALKPNVKKYSCRMFERNNFPKSEARLVRENLRVLTVLSRLDCRPEAPDFLRLSVEFPINTTASFRGMLQSISADSIEAKILGQYLLCTRPIKGKGLLNFWEHLETNISNYSGVDRSRLIELGEELKEILPADHMVSFNQALCAL